MSSYKSIGIFNGDKRQVYMALSLLDKGYLVYTFNLQEPLIHQNHIAVNSIDELITYCKVLIGPIPLTLNDISLPQDILYEQRGTTFCNMLTKEHALFAGNIPTNVLDMLKKKEIFFYDLLKNETIAVLNAIATAEGTIMEAIRNSDGNLHGSSCLILGYGRCGKVLASKLKGLDAKVTVAARNEHSLAYAKASGFSTLFLNEIISYLEDYEYIFNTIPSLILDKECLRYVSPDVNIIDIASAPGGVDFEYAKDHDINAKLCLGLPGKVAPKSSADILLNEIGALLKERSG
ncbi:MAG: dipicolinate synthase subunit DpsA [Clostridiales bacterium]|nr:dipicolinate synthase subunit DpsA [Clostridiales bacterium]